MHGHTLRCQNDLMFIYVKPITINNDLVSVFFLVVRFIVRINSINSLSVMCIFYLSKSECIESEYILDVKFC